MRNIPLPEHDKLITSWTSGEDAALWRIDEERAGILTLDFVTPIVDDPFQWGQIAASNSLSDIFAMGGKPFIALNIVGFPVKTLPLEVLEKVISGGNDKVREAGAFLLGGHSVEDEEPKYGLAVYGEVMLDRIWKVTGAKPGDHLILTKPVGTGVISTAIKADMVEDPRGPEESIKWMSALNDLPLRIEDEILAHIHACTDVTGFGLAGHSLDMLSLKDLDLILGLGDIPLLPGAVALAEMGLLPAGTYNNRIQYEDRVEGKERFPETQVDMIFDPQTSGGLILAVDPCISQTLLESLHQAGFERSDLIGSFTEGQGRIRIVDHVTGP